MEEKTTKTRQWREDKIYREEKHQNMNCFFLAGNEIVCFSVMLHGLFWSVFFFFLTCKWNMHSCQNHTIKISVILLTGRISMLTVLCITMCWRKCTCRWPLRWFPPPLALCCGGNECIEKEWCISLVLWSALPGCTCQNGCIEL